MAFPWEVIAGAKLATDDIAEDMRLSYELILAGKGARFCPEVRIVSMLPSRKAAADSQRTRWEHGHLRTMCRELPRLAAAAVVGRKGALMSALDLMIPPVSLLALAWLAVASLSIGAGIAGWGWSAAGISGLAGLALALSLVIARNRFARDGITWKSLCVLPAYVLWKVPRWIGFAFRRQRAWVRTARDGAASEN